ncbi:MAG TPA: hypothetical protein VIX60_06735 [Candidatus Cybelea sp.]
MFGRHERNEPLGTLRDAVEIVAIVAAGLWALYVFAYEQRFKPASEPPSLRLTGSLHKLGTHNGLVQLAIKATISNNGSTDATLIATGFTADGLRYASNSTPTVDRSINGLTMYQRDAHVASRTLIYRTVEMTRLASPKYSSSFTLQPGQELPYSAIFAIKAGEFDAVTLYASIAYSKRNVVGAFPMKAELTPTNAVYFAAANANSDYTSAEVTLDQISLW